MDSMSRFTEMQIKMWIRHNERMAAPLSVMPEEQVALDRKSGFRSAETTSRREALQRLAFWSFRNSG